MTGVFQKEFRAQQNSYGHLITVLVSSGHFSHGGMQNHKWTWIRVVRLFRKEKEKKGPLHSFVSPSFFQIAEHVVSTNGFLSKLSLCRALALITLAQQGKQPSPKLLENCIHGGCECRRAARLELNEWRGHSSGCPGATTDVPLPCLVCGGTNIIIYWPTSRPIVLQSFWFLCHIVSFFIKW